MGALLFDLDNTLIDRDAAFLEVLDERFDFTPDERRAALAADDHGRRPRAEITEIFGPWRPIAQAIARRTRPFPEAREVLESLKTRFRLGLVSNGHGPTQREKLARSGLEDLFEVIVVSQEVGAPKPDPKPFRAALDALGVDAAGTWFVGDNPIADIGGASALGMTTVWRRHGPPDPSVTPDHEVDDLTELEGLLS